MPAARPSASASAVEKWPLKAPAPIQFWRRLGRQEGLRRRRPIAASAPAWLARWITGDQPPETIRQSAAMLRASPDSVPVASVEGLHLDAGECLAALGADDGMAGENSAAGFAASPRGCWRNLRAHVDDRATIAAPASRKRARGAIGAVIVGEERDLLARQHAELVGVALGGAGQHHARPVVAGEHQRPLEGAGGEHDRVGADRPVAVARLALAARPCGR